MNNWIEGRLPMMRDPVQVETPEGVRAIIACPSCGGARGLNVVRWRRISPEITKGNIERSDSPYGPPGNKEGKRLVSKCCGKDIRAVAERLICSHCLETCDEKKD